MKNDDATMKCSAKFSPQAIAVFLLSTWIAPVVAAETAKEIPLYPGAAPGSEKWDWSERAVTTQTGLPMVQDVVRPVLLHYAADGAAAVGTAIIVAPGGGFRTLMMSYEGVDIARQLNAMGVDAFVLKYRLLYSGPGAPTGGPSPSPSSGERPRRFTVTAPTRPKPDRTCWRWRPATASRLCGLCGSGPASWA